LIYLSIHQVIGRRGRRGINRYYYEHPRAATRTAEGEIDPSGLASGTESPGKLIAFETEVPPGGNRVEEFLDVVLDGPVPGPLIAAVREVASHFDSVQLPLVHTAADIGIVFDLEYRLKTLARQRFIFLSNAALRWLENPPKQSLRDQSPMVILVRRDATGITYELDLLSTQRLRALKGNDFTPSVVSISHHTQQDLEQLVGSFVGHLGAILTHLREDELLQAGGVIFIDAATKGTLAAWPSREQV
jgi:hypothetical protein